jgi:hypothetical protein
VSKQPVNKIMLPFTAAKVASAVQSLFQGKHPSLWNFWKDGVSSSFLSYFNTCLEQTRLCYVEGWSSRSVPLAFEFGTCMHWVFEQVYGTVRTKPPSEDECRYWVSEYQKVWMKTIPYPTAKQLEQQELVYGMAEAVLPYYFTRWEGDFTGTYRWHNNTTAPVQWHSLEETFKYPYTFPDGKQTVLRGKRDGVFVDRRGKYWVFDTKCRSVINHDDALETLPFDTQQMLYLYATAMELKKMPAGVIMNIVRRPGQRRGDGEELPPFLGRIRKDVSNPKRYDHYFVRYEMVVGRDELLEWKKNQLDPMMQTVRMWWEGKLPHYLREQHLITKYGHCSMYAPIVRKEFAQCYKRQYAFNELTENL